MGRLAEEVTKTRCKVVSVEPDTGSQLLDRRRVGHLSPVDGGCGRDSKRLLMEAMLMKLPSYVQRVYLGDDFANDLGRLQLRVNAAQRFAEFA